MATLDGTKWKVEQVKDKNDIVIEPKDRKETISLWKCEGCVVTVKGKFTNLVMDNCKKSAVICDTVIASVEIVNCQSPQLQVNDNVPNIMIDKSQSCTIYLQSEASRNVEIVTSGAEVNVVTPGKTENDDPLEQTIPTQYISTFGTDGKLHTKPTEHLGV